MARSIPKRDVTKSRSQTTQARFLKRQLSFPVSTMSQWWVRRSRRAAVAGNPLEGFVRATAGRMRLAQHAQTQAAIRPRGRATRPTRSQQRDVKIGLCSRPQANLADFYREMGDLFGVELRPHNRWAGAKVLRERWQTHIDASLARPVLVVDEAQEMLSTVLSELRLLCSTRLNSHILLTVVLASDGRLLERLRSDEFLPLASRMRVRLAIERATPDELQEYLR